MWEGRANLGATLSKVTFLSNNEKREILGFEEMSGQDKLPEKLPPLLAPPEHDDMTTNGSALQ
jgi:hypothetical protein